MPKRHADVVTGFDPRAIRTAYEAVADEYAVKFGDDLRELELDRSLLDAMAARVAARAPVLDLGCGPAQVGRYLSARGVDVIGIDFAPAMLAVARRHHPALAVIAADLRRLPFRTGGCAGATAFYVLQHLPRSALPGALRELRRVLAPGSVVVLAAHAGRGEFRPSPHITATRYAPAELEASLATESFVVETVAHRDPLPHEHQADRVYVVARVASG